MLVAKKMLKTVTIDYLSTLTDISDIQEADFKNLMEAAQEQAKVMLEKFEVKCKKNKVGVECWWWCSFQFLYLINTRCMDITATRFNGR